MAERGHRQGLRGSSSRATLGMHDTRDVPGEWFPPAVAPGAVSAVLLCSCLCTTLLPQILWQQHPHLWSAEPHHHCECLPHHQFTSVHQFTAFGVLWFSFQVPALFASFGPGLCRAASSVVFVEEGGFIHWEGSDLSRHPLLTWLCQRGFRCLCIHRSIFLFVPCVPCDLAFLTVLWIFRKFFLRAAAR